jgi:hypothetical protein
MKHLYVFAHVKSKDQTRDTKQNLDFHYVNDNFDSKQDLKEFEFRKVLLIKTFLCTQCSF